MKRYLILCVASAALGAAAAMIVTNASVQPRAMAQPARQPAPPLYQPPRVAAAQPQREAADDVRTTPTLSKE